ncbi:proline dehydrogenase family protein [Ascidiimonas aurantiaca]|uniref:proline dehydrogenase family protein n=1 Tax=Ascidiimonas aurantiaca TaxID=1685432 RepID=UPI0030EB212E
MKKIFDNTEIAFSLKSNNELKKARLLFQVMSSPTLVKLGTWLTLVSLKWKLPVKSLIKNTIFQQFCGGTDLDECKPIINKLLNTGVTSIMDYSVEGKEEEAEFDKALQTKLLLIEFAKKNKGISYASMKPSALGRFAIWQKVTGKEALSEAEQKEWDRIEVRFDTICKRATELHVPIMVDAEESWMQDAADKLVEKMMRRYNIKDVIVFNTVQCYRWDRLDFVKDLEVKARNGGFLVGVKLVRGAYMEKENERAKTLNYPTPICADKAATDLNFDEVLRYTIDRLDIFSVFVGSHNEPSTYLAMELMEAKGLKKDHSRIWFGQLYGMSDQITYNLAKYGYNVTKLLPFGPIKEVIPYLIRRAEENTSVAGQTGRELLLLNQELKRRKI